MFDDGLNLTSEQLMRHALTKYDTINQRSATKHEGEPAVLALQATAPKQETKNDIIKSLIAKLGEAKGKKSVRKVPNWKKKEPTSKESSTQVVNGKKYHWCPKHKLWTIHTPNDCTLQLDGESKPDHQPQKDDPTIALSKALIGMMNEEEDE
jgi:hypothetical protein